MAAASHRSVLMLCLLLAPCLSASREIYRWVDEHGKTHFEDRRGHRAASALQMPSGPAQASPAGVAERTEKTRRLLDQFAAERSQREADRQKAEQAATAKAEACREARGRAIEAEEAGYLYDRDERGRKRILDDAETLAVRQHARSEAARLCD